ncbi:MAG TPA: fumarylacetoacetate hydrolase family protein [Polyangiaceae bacterium]|nr:fumarylacetoacetate hydrolase family protein [Polyangiaceae bacterium]
MRLCTLRDGTRDGALHVVHPDGKHSAPATAIARTLQAALDDWETTEPRLRELATKLASSEIPGEPIDFLRVAAPLPRAYEWVDGSAYINHIVLVRKARGAEPPKTLLTDPLVYQGGSSDMLGALDPIELANPEWGLDFESEIGVILGDTPRGVATADVAPYIRLFVVINDVTLRNLIPAELEKGFGFFVSKPATAFAPFAVTPDELGASLKDGRVHLKLRTWLNGALVGDPDAGPAMHFSFHDLVHHITRSRRFGAGTIVGSGTVSNEDRARGISCLAERRMIEIIDTGKATTPFLKEGDTVAIDLLDDAGRSIMGKIEQKVVRS